MTCGNTSSPTCMFTITQVLPPLICFPNASHYFWKGVSIITSDVFNINMAFVWKIPLIFLATIGLAQTNDCPPFWTRYGNNCYRFFGPNKSWHVAEDHCKQFWTRYGQGHLASIHNNDENKFMIEMWNTSLPSLENIINDRMWFGLTDQEVEGRFVWSDMTALDFQAWLVVDGQPDNGRGNENCVDFWNQYGSRRVGWNDEDCVAEHSYICKIPTTCSR